MISPDYAPVATVAGATAKAGTAWGQEPLAEAPVHFEGIMRAYTKAARVEAMAGG
ncbi:hypothetical protein [Oceanicola sp. 502str15]|uniref:hypothetical protein n=1 Tax=Oceanicola sp. 502str15 TaxID=2696061 RepID=UPI0020964ABD|nr:hypothetical protein [Oceanicola sp. 502str15]MCO6381994.1 hypothetical protein [Oceanicola sp. 502str15]